MTDVLTAITLIPRLLQALDALQGATGYAPPAQREPPRIEHNTTLAELAETVLKCYHPSGRFQTVRVIESPWREGATWKARSSALLQIQWTGAVLRSPYVINVGVLERDDKVRSVLQHDTALLPASNKCALDSWTDVRR